MAVLVFIYGYIGWRIIIPLGLAFGWNAVLWAALIFFMIIPLLPIFLRIYGFETSLVDILAWISYISLGFFFLVFTFLVIRDVAWLTVSGVEKAVRIAQDFFSGTSAVEPTDPVRRSLIQNAINIGILGFSGTLAGYGLYEARRHPAVVNVLIPINDLPYDLEDIRVNNSRRGKIGKINDRLQILQALEKTDWNKAKAARLLGIHRATIYKMMKKYDITKKEKVIIG